MAERSNKPILPFFTTDPIVGAARAARFWSYVAKRGPDECWLWTGSTANKGYGRFKVASYQNRHANRIAFVLTYWVDPLNLIVMHKCDNPPCCNPKHLVLGTDAENSADKIAKGRNRCADMSGSKNPSAKLTEADIPRIVEMMQGGMNNTAISRQFDVGHALISRIRLGLSWREQAEACGWEPVAQFQRKAA